MIATDKVLAEVKAVDCASLTRDQRELAQIATYLFGPAGPPTQFWRGDLVRAAALIIESVARSDERAAGR